MAEVKGKMITCKRDNNWVFLKYLGERDLYGGYETYDKYEKLPDDWMYETEFGYLCPKCTREFEMLMTNFFNGDVITKWKLETEVKE